MRRRGRGANVAPTGAGGEALSRALMWALAGSVAVLVAALGLRKIWTVDYWWLLKTGEYVARHGVPRTDVFSYTDFGRARLELRWGFCLGLWALTNAFGHGAAVIAKTLIAASAFALAASIVVRKRVARSDEAIALACAMTAMAALASSQRFYERPEMVSCALFVAFVAIVDLRRERPTRWIWALPVLQILWVNCHGLFLLGPAVVAAWLVEEGYDGIRARLGSRVVSREGRRRSRAAAWLLVGTLGASLVNPFFHRAFLLPLTQFQVLHGTAQKDFFVEFLSPFAMGGEWAAVRWYELLIVLAVLSAVVNFRRQRPFWLLLVGSQLYLSATAVRNLPLFALVAIPFTVHNAAETVLPRTLLRRPGARAGAAAAMALAAVLCLLEAREIRTNRFALREGDTNQSGIGIARNRYPERAAEFLEASDAQGPIFNPPAIGSYLIARGFKVFIDPRGEEHMDRVIGEYREIMTRHDRFDAYAARYGFRIAIFRTADVEAILAMRSRPDWRLVYVDPVAAIFFHRGTAPSVQPLDLAGAAGERWFAGIETDLPRPVPYAERGFLTRLDNPGPYLDLSRLCLALGAEGFGRTLNEWAYQAYPPGFTR